MFSLFVHTLSFFGVHFILLSGITILNDRNEQVIMV